MKILFYCITISLLVIWISGIVNSNTGNILAIAATVLSAFSEGATVRTAV